MMRKPTPLSDGERIAIIKRLDQDLDGRHLNSQASYHAVLQLHDILCFEETIHERDLAIRNLERRLRRAHKKIEDSNDHQD